MASSRAVARASVVGLAAGEHHVAALDVGRHVSVAEPGHDRAQIRHRDLVTAADVDAAQQGDVSGHDSILPQGARLACAARSATALAPVGGLRRRAEVRRWLAAARAPARRLRRRRTVAARLASRGALAGGRVPGVLRSQAVAR